MAKGTAHFFGAIIQVFGQNGLSLRLLVPTKFAFFQRHDLRVQSLLKASIDLFKIESRQNRQYQGSETETQPRQFQTNILLGMLASANVRTGKMASLDRVMGHRSTKD